MPRSGYDGTVYKTERGRWRARILVAGRRESKTFPTRAAAETWIRGRRAEKSRVELDGAPRAANPTVTYEDAGKALVHWWEAGVRRRYSKATLTGYKQELAVVLREWGNQRVSATTTSQADKWIGSMRKSGLATSTIRNRVNILIAMLKHCLRERWLVALPCLVERPLVRNKSRRQTLPAEELDLLLSRSDDDRASIALLLAYDAGLRRGELVRLRWSDIDEDFQWLHVRSEGDSDERTKSGKGRDVPIRTTRLRDALQSAHEARLSDEVFPGISSVDGIDKLVRRLAGRSVLHAARHSFITNAANEGVNPWELVRWAGHSTLQVTLGYYHGPSAARFGGSGPIQAPQKSASG